MVAMVEVKREAIGKLSYEIAHDAWVFKLIIPRGEKLESYDGEYEFYRRKALAFAKFCLEEKELTALPGSHP